MLTRVDRNINFNWDKVVAGEGLQRNNYSVRWSGSFTPPAPGDYKLGVRMNYCYACENAEGFRLYLDGKLLVESEREPTGERGAVIEAPVHFAIPQPTPSGSSTCTARAAPASILPGRRRRRRCATRRSRRRSSADVTIAFVGLSPSLEGEEMPVKLDGFSGGDRTAIDLPAVQEDC